MSEERLKILEMLQNGKITADEAAALLKEVRDDDERPSHERRDNGRQRYDRQNGGYQRYNSQNGDHQRYDRRNCERQHYEWRDRARPYTNNPDFGWLDDLRAVIGDTASTIGDAVREAINNSDYPFAPRQETFTAALNNGEIREFVFEGKNAPMKLESYGGDTIEVTAFYRAKAQWNPRFAFGGEDGVYSLRYDDNALYALGLNIRVPESAHIGGVTLKNRNAPISADGIAANSISLNTKNAPVSLLNGNGKRVACETRNAPITLESISADGIDAKTSNARITLANVKSYSAQFTTSNAKIEAMNSGIAQLYAKTSNGHIRFENMGYNGQEPVYSIEAITTNAQISVNVPNRDLICKLRASTTNGGVSTELGGLEYQVNEKNYVEARSRGYETAHNKINLNLQTTNGGIRVY